MKPAPSPAATGLYAPHRKIQPRAISGVFTRWRWALVWITQAVFYGLPWLAWNGRPAVLFDLGARQFFLFGTVLYPQDFVYLTGLLVISAMALFLFTAVAGRLWCGFACPQTVYTEIFMWIEHHIEGDRVARIKLDLAPICARKLALRATKHALWLAVALWTGITFVGYFTGIHTLLGEIATLGTGAWETFWVLFYAFATWGNAGFMREQVCKYMCPYARFQSAMFDRDTLVISYDSARGEPRGSRPRSADPKALGLGSCVDCAICVQVCPTGIDIRHGLQYECIGCAACVDACDMVMSRMGYAPGLVRFDTENAMVHGWTRAQLWRRALRPRVAIYGVLLAGITIALFAHMATRVALKVDVLRDRGAMSREVEDGMIENVYRLQLMNTSEKPRRFWIGVTGVPTAFVATPLNVDVEAGGHLMVPVRVRVLPGNGKPGTNRMDFQVHAVDDPQVSVQETSTFILPR